MTPNEFITELQQFFVDDTILAITDINGNLPNRISDLASFYPLEGFEGGMQTLDGSSYLWSLHQDSDEDWVFHAMKAG